MAKVSKSFFDEYTRVFEVMRDAVKGFGSSEAEQDRRHLFAQRLFNRLMFLRFIQKKGWLTIDGSTDYLASLWASHGKVEQEGKNFYADRLRLLFKLWMMSALESCCRGKAARLRRQSAK